MNALRCRSDHCVELGNERVDGNSSPFASVPCPASRVFCSFRLLQRMARLQSGLIPSGVSLHPPDYTDATVSMIVVILLHERPRPRFLGLRQRDARALPRLRKVRGQNPFVAAPGAARITVQITVSSRAAPCLGRPIVITIRSWRTHTEVSRPLRVPRLLLCS